jgi:hypothetical protein
MNIKIEVALALLTQFIGFCLFIWKISAWYAILNTKIEKNHVDINNVGKTVRENAREDYRIIQMEISHIQEHLIKIGDYHPPTIKRWEDS